MKERGFSLIEIAIVLVVIGLIISGGIAAFGAIGKTSQTTQMQKRLDVVDKAITAYVYQNGCLPCPADGTLPSSNGSAGHTTNTSAVYSGCTATACIVANGVVPWVNLGISEEDASDLWGNRIKYVVAGNPTTAFVCTGAAAPIAGSLAQTGGMTRDADVNCYPRGNLTVNANGQPQTTQAAYVLVSTGPDESFGLAMGTGAAGTDKYGQDGGGGGQDENDDDDTTFVEGPQVLLDGTTRFDDIVRRRTAPMIIQDCGSNADQCGNPE